MAISRHFNQKQTSQLQPIPGRTDQVQNAAGGFVFALDPWKQLDRFLILGSEAGTYYTSEKELTIENAESVLSCIKEDGPRVVAQTVDVSTKGRAYKNDVAIFVLALLMKFGDKPAREAAYQALPSICRIPTHLFGLLNDLKELDFSLTGAGFRRALARYYNNMPASKLAYHLVKYRQRDGWTHRDVLRLAHAKPVDAVHSALYNYALNGWPAAEPVIPLIEFDLIYAYEQAAVAEDEKTIIRLVTDANLPWEALDTKWLASAKVWEALLPKLPITALIRNLARMTRNGLLAPMSDASKFVVDRITNEDLLRKSPPVHPIQLLAALVTYAGGESAFTGSGHVRQHMSHHTDVEAKTWEPVSQIIDALDAAFYLSFDNIEPTGKRFLLGIDTSGSMTMDPVSGIPNLYPRTAAAAMAMVIANTEKDYLVVAYDTVPNHIPVSPRQRLSDVVALIARLDTGGTDCAAPALYAIEHKLDIDAFVNLTDHETWRGRMHPMQALNHYRKALNPSARLAVVGMTAVGRTIADPNDTGSLDVVGLDTATPRLIADFAAERI